MSGPSPLQDFSWRGEVLYSCKRPSMTIISLAAAITTFLFLTVYSAINYRKNPSFGLFISIVACGSCVLLLLTDLFCKDAVVSLRMAVTDIFSVGVLLAAFPCSFENVSLYRRISLSYLALYLLLALLCWLFPEMFPVRLVAVRILSATGPIVNMALSLHHKYSSDRVLARKTPLPWVLEYDSRMFYSFMFFNLFLMYGFCSSMDGGLSQFVSHVLMAAVVAVVSVMTLKACTSRSFILDFRREEQWKKQVTAKAERPTDVNLIRPSEYDRDRMLFDKIQAFMRDKKPFLDPDFNVSSLSRGVLSNKLYTSRAVNNVSGMNFCRYVNGYRIEYAKSLFKSNPGLKVMDVSEMSGFHNLPSFNMAFKVCTGLTPSEWIRINIPGQL